MKTKPEPVKVDKKVEARARKLYATFAEAFKLKRTWERIGPAEQSAWLAVAKVD